MLDAGAPTVGPGGRSTTDLPLPVHHLQMPQRAVEPEPLPKLTPLLTATVWRGPSEAPSGDACRPVSPGCGCPPLALALLCAARSRLSLA